MTRQSLDAPAIIARIRLLMERMNLRQGTFAARIGLDAGNFSKILSGNMPVSSGLVNRIVADIGVSKIWLTTGRGLPFERSLHADTVDEPEAVMTEAECSRGVPVYDIDVTAGRGELSMLFTRDRIVGRIDLPNMPDDTAVIHVSGNSMTPVINDGAYLAIRPISDMRYIFWGQIYVIVMDDYRMVKFLRKHPTDGEMVILRSANPDYDDMEVRRSDIRRLFYVEVILNYDIRS